jgi:glycosyltransferase involved in cell wall biosynthesis
VSVGPPRVVHIVQHLKAGGAEVLVRSLAKGQRDAGIDARFLSIYPDKLDEDERRELGVPLVTIGRRSRTDLSFFGRLRRELRAEHADIVHAHLIAGKYAGRLAAVLERVPSIVFTEHGDDSTGPIAFAIDRVLDARTKRFITFSNEHRARLARHAKIALEKIVVIPNGVEEPPPGDRSALRRDLGIDPDVFALYIPARLVALKNQALALRALAMLGDPYQHWQIVLAGTGEMESELRDLARELGLGDRVRFLGFRTDAPRLFRAMDAFMIPSLHERMPLALGEAMRAGVAAVTTPWAGVEDFLIDTDTGFVADDFSVEAFARALARLRDDETRGAVAARAKVFADRRFDLGACVRSHVELYESLSPAATRGGRP